MSVMDIGFVIYIYIFESLGEIGIINNVAKAREDRRAKVIPMRGGGNE